jgi:hypothetical protein
MSSGNIDEYIDDLIALKLLKINDISFICDKVYIYL